MDCGTCRFWQYEAKHPNGFRFGECDHEPDTYDNMKSCDMFGSEDEKIITGEGFQCHHWKQK